MVDKLSLDEMLELAEKIENWVYTSHENNAAFHGKINGFNIQIFKGIQLERFIRKRYEIKVDDGKLGYYQSTSKKCDSRLVELYEHLRDQKLNEKQSERSKTLREIRELL